jgi:hypothetical protein
MLKNVLIISFILLIGTGLTGLLIFHNKNGGVSFLDSSYSKGYLGKVENFTLWDQHGESLRLYTHADAQAIVLISYEIGCPIVQHSISTIRQLRDHFQNQGVEFYFLDGNPNDHYPALVEAANDFLIDIPILRDPAQIVSESMHIVRTAEAIVINPKNWTIVYRGAIDDRLGYETQRPAAKRSYLADALEALLSHQRISIRQTEVMGCLINCPLVISLKMTRTSTS